MIDELIGCDKLIVIDACRSGMAIGSLTSFRWPDARISERHTRSTHQFGVLQTLQLAERLGRLPTEVIVYGIEIAASDPAGPICGEVLHAIDLLADALAAEFWEPNHA